MTEELFREDATLTTCESTVVAVDEAGIVLDRTVFYPLGGGQAGDAGVLIEAPTETHKEGGTGVARTLALIDTRKHKERPGDIAHVPDPQADLSWVVPGVRVRLQLDASRRRAGG